ncbi:MAG: hypothetical protein RIR00_308 [Pseudomonadota bacterium]
MQEPEAVGQMLALAGLGWGAKRIARELGVARNTVKRYLAAGRYVPYRSPARQGKLAHLGGLATAAVCAASRQLRRGATGVGMMGECGGSGPFALVLKNPRCEFVFGNNVRRGSGMACFWLLGEN